MPFHASEHGAIHTSITKAMPHYAHQRLISDTNELRQLFGLPSAAAVAKEVSFIHTHYRALIEASPFVVLATVGRDSLDVSPRGDAPGFVVVEDDATLLIPERRGNNRVDSLHNIVEDPRVALLFLIPGLGETLRVNGRASIVIAPELQARFTQSMARRRSACWSLKWSPLFFSVRAQFCARACGKAGRAT